MTTQASLGNIGFQIVMWLTCLDCKATIPIGPENRRVNSVFINKELKGFLCDKCATKEQNHD
jgi:hypothetical protein